MAAPWMIIRMWRSQRRQLRERQEQQDRESRAIHLALAEAGCTRHQEMQRPREAQVRHLEARLMGNRNMEPSFPSTRGGLDPLPISTTTFREYDLRFRPEMTPVQFYSSTQVMVKSPRPERPKKPSKRELDSLTTFLLSISSGTEED